MTTIASLLINTRLNTARLQADVKRSKGLMGGLGKDLISLGKVVGASAVVGFTAFSGAAISAASNAAETTAKFETVFGSATEEMNAFVSNLTQTVPATTAQLQGMTASLQDLLVPIGILPADATEMNKSFTQLAADLASFNNVPMAQALDAIRSGLVGSSEPLQQFGIDTRVAALEAKALELGLIQEGEKLDNVSRAHAVLAQATAQSTFAIGDAARTAGSTANQMKFLTADIMELTQAAGEAMLPTFSTVLNTLVELTGGAQDSGGSMVFLAEAVAFPVQAFFRFAEAVNDWIVKPILLGKKTFLEYMVTMKKFGRLVGFDTTAQIEDMNLAIMQVDDQMQAAENAANDWVSKQADLTDAINQFKTPAENAKTATKNYTTEVVALGKTNGALEKAAKEQKKLADELAAFVTQANNTIDPAADVITKYNALKDAGFQANEIQLLLNTSVTNAVSTLQELGKEIPLELTELQSLKTDLENAKTAASNMDSVIAGETGLTAGMIAFGAQLALTKGDMTGEDGIGKSFADLTQDIEDQKIKLEDPVSGLSAVWANQVSTIKTDFSAGVAEMIFEGGNLKESMVGIFKGMGTAMVRGLVETLFDPITEKFNDLIGGLLGGITGGVSKAAGGSLGGVAGGVEATDPGGGLGGFFSGLGGLGGILTAGIGGVVSGLVSGLISGPSKGKEVAFNTRLTLGWIKDHFPVWTQLFETLKFHAVTSSGAAVASFGELQGIKWWAGVRAEQMGTLISIQRDRVAPALESIASSTRSIDSKTPVEIVVNVASPTVNVSNVNGMERGARAAGAAAGDEILKTVKDGISTNKQGIRKAIQDLA